MRRVCIVRVDSFDGEDMHLHCGDGAQEHLFCVVAIGDDNSAEVIDSAYRSFDEALQAWPEARIGGSTRASGQAG